MFSIRLAVWILAVTVGPFPLAPSPAKAASGMAARVDCHGKIEAFRAAHRTREMEGAPSPPPAIRLLDADTLRAQVEKSLRMESALEGLYGIRIGPEALQSELDRMAAGSRSPARLKELFALLDNDPQALAECLARPVLVERRLRNAYQWDGRFHDHARGQVEAAARAGLAVDVLLANGAQLDHVIIRTGDERVEQQPTPEGTRVMVVEAKEFAEEAARLSAQSLSRPTAREPDAKGHALLTVEETADGWLHEVVLAQSDHEIEVLFATWQKRSFESWWQESASAWSGIRPADVLDGLRLPRIDTAAKSTPHSDLGGWVPASTPTARTGHTALWTGSEMIVFGMHGGTTSPKGYRYDPAIDTWRPLPGVGEPSAVSYHTAVWTGIEMIVWGGAPVTNTGARYDPATDRWTPTTTDGAPAARHGHTALWTGSEMIIWGGNATSGGRYSPTSDSWQPIASEGAPTFGRKGYWTGKEMLLWGDNLSNPTGTIGRYDPVHDTWSTSSKAPIYLQGSGAGGAEVWSGSELIVWSRCVWDACSTAAGLRYDPASDEWATMSLDGAPPQYWWFSAIWTGSEMIVWGGDLGSNQSVNVGGRYDPVADVWVPTPTEGAPGARYDHTAIWTGSEMIVWGGRSSNSNTAVLGTGGRLNPATGQWSGMSARNAPEARVGHTSVWTGQEMLVWGGRRSSQYFNSGGQYEPMTDTWTVLPTLDAPTARAGHSAVWTGAEMLVWGGTGGGAGFDTGGHYEPVLGQWTASATLGAPSGRTGHTTVWTGDEMIIWGGFADGLQTNSGARYEPIERVWVPTSLTDAPEPRNSHTAIWTGDELIVWGGAGLTSGGRYNPQADSWLATSVMGAPSARQDHIAVWTGQEMIVWGGSPLTTTGGRYRPTSDQWSPTSQVDVPGGRWSHSAVWTGQEVIVWGGTNGFVVFTPILLNTGGRYRPELDRWQATSLTGAPAGRSIHSAVWTGSQMIVWGGCCTHDTGGVYDPALLIMFRNGFE